MATDNGTTLKKLFPAKVIQDADAKIDIEDLSTECLTALSLNDKPGDLTKTSTSFVNLVTMTEEPDSKLPARQKLWNWMVKSLHGPKASPDPYHQVVAEVKHSDVQRFTSNSFGSSTLTMVSS